MHILMYFFFFYETIFFIFEEYEKLLLIVVGEKQDIVQVSPFYHRNRRHYKSLKLHTIRQVLFIWSKVRKVINHFMIIFYPYMLKPQ